MSNSNTRSDLTVSVTFTSESPGDVVPQVVVDELERRIQASVDETATAGDAVVSQVPPDDTTKIWYIADANGVPTGEAFKYNTSTGGWESTSPTIPEETCVSANTDNLISKDTSGCLLVSTNDVRAAVQPSLPQISADAGNELELGTDAGWFVSSHTNQPTISGDSGNAIVVGGDSGWYVAQEDVSGTYGEIYGGNLNVPVASAATFYKVGVNQAGESSGVTVDTGNNDLEALTAGKYMVHASMSLHAVAGAGDTLIASVAVDGAPVTKTEMHQVMGAATSAEGLSLSGVLSLNANSLVTVVVQNVANTADIIVDRLNLTIKKL